MSIQTIQQFEDYLRSQGLRLTGQRQLIAAAFFNTKGHISTEELYRKVQRKSAAIGLTTVYRTLKLLTDAGLAAVKNFKDGLARFETTCRTDHHDHLVCIGCGKIIEFMNNNIEAMQREVADEHGFSVTDHTLDIYGICRDCRQAK
jgi:Fur family ferric uptake transcriptional regulator